MKREHKIWERLWGVLDRVLLLLVLALIAAVWLVGSGQRGCATGAAAATEADAALPQPVARPAGRVINPLRVSRGESRFNTIARNMLDVDWECSPSRPAFDMRESERVYEVMVALPAGASAENIRVNVVGSALTLALVTPEGEQTPLRRVRLPCNIECAEHVTSAISNNVLHVRIRKGEGHE